MYAIILRDDHFEEDLAFQIARIAKLSHNLGEKLRADKGVMKQEEAFIQLGHSASLLQALPGNYSKKK
jgi:hypothetical protein